MRVGLLLGGGGTVGIAWETGVLAGLQDACGFKAGESTVIVGTSAGSAVGADIALGKDPHELLELQGETARALSALKPPDRENGPFAEIFQLMTSREERNPDWVTRIGELALKAETFLTEEQFVESFRQTLGTDAWPATDFRATAACCNTGERRVWAAADGIALSRAVASSCAIPGFFPTISFEDQNYFDSARGKNYHTEICGELELDAAIYLGPKVMVPGVAQMILDDMAALAATGVRTHTILGSERLDKLGLNLMDNTQRPRAFELGKEDGADQAAAIAELLG
jgi:NTE family protein